MLSFAWAGAGIMAWEKKGGRVGPAGSILRDGPRGVPQRVRTSGWQWSDEAEEIFFDTLAATANVSLAAAKAGFSTPTVYRLKARRADFAEKWRAALVHGFDRLETELLRTAIDSVAPDESPEEAPGFATDRPIPKMSYDQAMNILNAHRKEVRGSGANGPGRRPSIRSLDEVQASILRKIAAIERAGSVDPAPDPATGPERDE